MSKRKLNKGKDFDELMELLKVPFAFQDLEWIINNHFFANNSKTDEDLALMCAPYIRRESVIIRMNSVLGAGGWKTQVIPLGNFGTYYNILVDNGYEWVDAVDGATMQQVKQLSGDASGNKNADVVKGVVTKSLRRAAELWEVGLYLHFIPRLFAQKRPLTDYESYGKWSKEGLSFSVRWDPPPLLKEFLPEFMTPEQASRLNRAANYFSDDSETKKKIRELTDSFNNDWKSVKYDEAEKVISYIDSKISLQLAAFNKYSIIPAAQNKKQESTDKTATKQGKNPAKSEESEEKPKNPLLTTKETNISTAQIENLEVTISFLKEKDPSAQYHDSKLANQFVRAIKELREGSGLFFVEKVFNSGVEKLEESYKLVKSSLDDELPF